MKGFRSPMLGALLALACTPSMEVARREEDVHHLFFRSVSMHAPDLDHAETVKLLLADARAAQLVGGSYEHEARGIADDFEAWANGGRRPILIRDEAVAGEWRARIAFLGPGNYMAETYRQAAQPGERGEVIVREATTRVDAWRVAVEEAKARALDGQVAQLSAAMGHDVRPEVDALMKSPTNIGEEWRKLRDALNAAAGKQAIENSVVVGEVEAGPVTPVEELSADEFAARFGPVDEHGRLRGVIKSINLRIKVDEDGVTVDDIVPSAREQQATLAAFRRAAAELEVNAIKPDADGFYSMADIATTVGVDLAAPEVLSTIRDDAGRALAHVAMPAGRPLTMGDMSTAADKAFERMRPANRMRFEPFEYQPKPAPRPVEPPCYSAKPKPAKPPKGPEARAQQRQRKAGRTATKKRRGWS